jgi:4-phospho-D-threonate 3-dehydrogenase / 4-phospho-D-erythronate 3-dehydrogenase
MTRKTLLLTLGDPSGIGPEVLVKALARLKPPKEIHIKAIGEYSLLDECAARMGMHLPGYLEVESLGLLTPGSVAPGVIQAKCGDAAYRYFTHAVKACLRGDAHGICTAPISKEAMNLAGHHFVGHTDILDRMTGDKGVVMSLWHPKLVVGHVTDHMSLRDALQAICETRVMQVVELTWHSMLQAGRVGPDGRPRLALAGVNPHAGENGLFGREEIEILKPAMEKLELKGIVTSGPFAADTVFLQGLRGRFDGVIAMYHDQGFGPMKTIGFADGVNCTLGLPFVRTSPDHGTAYEIAGLGKAEPESMEAALRLAIQLMQNQ